MKKKNQESTERGQSLMEFSVSLVFVLVLLAGLVDLGRGLFTYMALRDGAQEGAAYGSLNPTETSTIQNRVYGSSTMLQSQEGEGTIDIQVNITGVAGNEDHGQAKHGRKNQTNGRVFFDQAGAVQ